MKVNDFLKVANSDVCIRNLSSMDDIVTVSSCYLETDCLSKAILNTDIDYINAEQNCFYVYLRGDFNE